MSPCVPVPPGFLAFLKPLGMLLPVLYSGLAYGVAFSVPLDLGSTIGASTAFSTLLAFAECHFRYLPVDVLARGSYPLAEYTNREEVYQGTKCLLRRRLLRAP